MKKLILSLAMSASFLLPSIANAQAVDQKALTQSNNLEISSPFNCFNNTYDVPITWIDNDQAFEVKVRNSILKMENNKEVSALYAALDKKDPTQSDVHLFVLPKDVPTILNYLGIQGHENEVPQSAIEYVDFQKGNYQTLNVIDLYDLQGVAAKYGTDSEFLVFPNVNNDITYTFGFKKIPSIKY